MNDIRKLLTKLSPLISAFRAHARFIYLVLLLLSCAFLVYRINAYANVAPTDDEVITETKTITKPRVDKAALIQLQNLQDQNIEVQTLFEEARNNPFNE